MSLRDDLQTVDGVGPATASELVDVIGERDHDSDDVREALDYLEAGKPGYAAKFLRRVVGE